MPDPLFLLSDPMFYAVAVPAVILVGLSKGGLGGAAALMGVPVMALVINPVQAAAILLPILIVMDLVSLWTWRHWRDLTTLKVMLPGAIIGIGLGWLTAAFVTVDAVRLIVGLVAVGFVLRWFYQLMARQTEARAAQPLSPAPGGGLSPASRASSPMPAARPTRSMQCGCARTPKIYTGTAVMFFAAVNAVKLVPYFALGLVRHRQSGGIRRAGARRPPRDARRRVDRQAHEAGDLLPLHVFHGPAGRPEAGLGRSLLG